MVKPVLVIMAAGMGSRYGGLKQIDPVDKHGNLIIDFSIYDAIEAGFNKIIFIIKHEIEEDFKEKIGNRIENYIEVEYVYQELDNLPENFILPAKRVKPWGTCHAVLCCKDFIDGPFAVINADDYYGKEAFKMIYEALICTTEDVRYQYSMIGYILGNTLTEHGYVARGVCQVSEDGILLGIKERTQIEQRGNEAAYSDDGGQTWVNISPNSTVSMNMWGFTKSIFGELDVKFRTFLSSLAENDTLKKECFLPSVVGELLVEDKAFVKVLQSKDRWFGVTYKEDKVAVVNAIREFKAKGLYPEHLWR